MNPGNFNISFRPIEPGDVTNLVRWQRDPDVTRWYWDVANLTDDELTQKWTQRASGTDTSEDLEDRPLHHRR